MLFTLKNTRFIQPFVEEQTVTVPTLDDTILRDAYLVNADLNNETVIEAGQYPVSTRWCEIWIDGFRLVNPSLDFGQTGTAYNVSGKTITFSEPVTGSVQAIFDGPFNYDLPDYLIYVSNTQGAKTDSKVNGQVLASYFCEPLILSQPANGFVRLTDDRLNLLYVPQASFEGYDSFSYTVINDRGQIAAPKCVFVTVGTPTTSSSGSDDSSDSSDSSSS